MSEDPGKCRGLECGFGAFSGELSTTSPSPSACEIAGISEIPGSSKSASKPRARPIRFIRVSTSTVG